MRSGCWPGYLEVGADGNKLREARLCNREPAQPDAARHLGQLWEGEQTQAFRTAPHTAARLTAPLGRLADVVTCSVHPRPPIPGGAPGSLCELRAAWAFAKLVVALQPVFKYIENGAAAFLTL